MPKNKTLIRFVTVVLGVNALGASIALLFFGYTTLLNLELSFLLTMLIVVATFVSYKTKLKDAQSDYQIDDDIDELDKIDDKHGLYQELKEEPQKSPQKQKSFTLSRMLLGSRLFFSVYRLLFYLFLVIAVMALIKNGMFEALSLIAGTTLFMLSAAIFYVLELKFGENR